MGILEPITEFHTNRDRLLKPAEPTFHSWTHIMENENSETNIIEKPLLWGKLGIMPLLTLMEW